ncbi:radical SAM protein [Parabacteroides sp. ZJ-118]|uniref:B12-binding domain-containing radical SAM protein n=1 Tax=Parabacteroides sp. ZJ-118 TaxID=2709398 RepID=UPI0013EA2664|nr:radical SAM protein [Parabacteroides sp. ZJ-118]
MEQASVLLVLSPFTQINTPYPSTAYLKGYLESKGVHAAQADLGIETILALFSERGLGELFDEIERRKGRYPAKVRRMLADRRRYIDTIGAVVAFLQGKNDTLAYRICDRAYLPGSDRGSRDEEELEWAFGAAGLRDRARYLATSYLEGLCDLIRETIDPDFGFSRYAERLGRCASSFDEIEEALQRPSGFIERLTRPLLERHLAESRPKAVAFSVPFPGNLFSALRLARWLRQTRPGLPILMGGGFANTELRSIADTRFFKYIDYLMLDDGEDPLYQLLRYLEGAIPRAELVRTFSLDESGRRVVYQDNPAHPACRQSETGFPDYGGLPLDRYISVLEMANPTHRLWSDGRWNKLTLAHGCYWGKCAFCDGSLDYIKRYEPNKARTVVDRMERLIGQTGEIGFHFVDEAAPPALLREMALEILRRGLTVVWWGNIRFEKSYTRELCELLQRSGCVAVSGGLEVASPRLLKLINKGVTVAQVARVAHHFTAAGIRVHAYLMYGLPTQTAQETIDSLETVRQMFELGLIQSGFWHRFALTAHSPAGARPAAYGCRVTEPPFGGFARNDLRFEALSGCDPELFSEGLRVSLYNYMNGTGFDLPLQRWFGGLKVPRTTLPPNYIEKILLE